MPPIIPTGVPFAQIPHALILDGKVSHTAVRVYCYLMRRANSDGRAFPGVRRIANEIGMGRNTARRGIEALEAAGWITVEREYDSETQKHKVNQYTIHGTRVGSERTQGVSELDPGGGATTGTELDPQLTTSSELQVAATPRQPADGLSIVEEERLAARPRNPWWDVTVEIFGEPTEGQTSLYGRFISMVSNVDANRPSYTADEIRRRAAMLAQLWGVKAVTVASLEKHWSRFDAAIGQVSDADVGAFTESQDRAAMLERLADE